MRKGEEKKEETMKEKEGKTRGEIEVKGQNKWKRGNNKA
jgi:hypothetical protein